MDAWWKALSTEEHWLSTVAAAGCQDGPTLGRTNRPFLPRSQGNTGKETTRQPRPLHRFLHGPLLSPRLGWGSSLCPAAPRVTSTMKRPTVPYLLPLAWKLSSPLVTICSAHFMQMQRKSESPTSPHSGGQARGPGQVMGSPGPGSRSEPVTQSGHSLSTSAQVRGWELRR